MQLSLEGILKKRFNYDKNVDKSDFEKFCNSYFTVTQSTVICQCFDGVPVEVLVSRHHMAASRIRNLAHVSVDRYYSLKLEKLTNN